MPSGMDEEHRVQVCMLISPYRGIRHSWTREDAMEHGPFDELDDAQNTL